MTTPNESNPSTSLALSERNQKLQHVRDEMAPGARPGAIVPRSFAELELMCKALAAADLAPKHLRGKPTDMALVIMTGAEVGLPPMASLRLYTTWDGVPRLMAEGMRAIILAHPECEWFRRVRGDETQSVWSTKRRGQPEQTVTWTIERAKRAGLLGKENWMKYPEDMLSARASMQLARLEWPDVVAGMVSREEAFDGDFIDVTESRSNGQAFTAPIAMAPSVDSMELRAAVAQLPKDAGRIVAEPAPVQVHALGVAGPVGTTAPTPQEGVPVQKGKRAATPTPPATSSAPSGSPAPSSSPASSASASTPAAAALSAATATPTTSSPSKLESAIATVEAKDRFGQTIAVDPTPPGSSTGPTPSTGSASPSTGNPPSGAAPGPASAPTAPTTSLAVEDEGGFADDPEDSAPPVDAQVPLGKLLVDFHKWLAECKTQRDLQAGFPKWKLWTKERVQQHNDDRFTKEGAGTEMMQVAYATRKSQVPA